MKHVHFIGIGGTGLSAIARVLLEKGYSVSGSDRAASSLFKAITAAGAQTYVGHNPTQIIGADLVIRSSAIPDDNPEVRAARSASIPVLKRSDFLEELTQDKDTLAIAGSHGKTTTTAMLIWMLDQLGTNPSFIAGGVIPQLGCNARAGTGKYFAIEADEYDYMFLGISPRIAVITNIEHDHPDCFPTLADYRAAFLAFLGRIRPDGHAILCVDDPITRALMKEFEDSPIHILGYGTSPDADYLIDDIQEIDGFPQFSVVNKSKNHSTENLGKVLLQLPGRHNILNATAALAVIHSLGLPISEAIDSIGYFTGVGRRFEIMGKASGVTLIDDYGHHPTQIIATLEASRTRYPDHRIWAVWEPHTFSRTQILEKEYIQALELADQVVILKIFAAREQNPGYSAQKIADSLSKEKARFIPDFQGTAEFLLEHLLPGDIVITFSAGIATEVNRSVLNSLKMKDKIVKGQPNE